MLQVKNISFAYDENPTLHDISMDFEEGRITGILGVNGSGKSTIMKIITRLLKPQKGSILYVPVSAACQYGLSESRAAALLYYCEGRYWHGLGKLRL